MSQKIGITTDLALPAAIGLNTPTFRPLSVRILAMAPAINVLPTPVSVPVIKRPAFLGRFRLIGI
jgi:hypothetical protein